MLQYLKLGGSLITNKDVSHTPRLDIIHQSAEEIAAYLKDNPSDRLIIGHGSGSFGHIPAKQYGTRNGVRSAEEWDGFHKVWQEARALHLIILQALLDAGLPVISFPPSGSITISSKQIISWNIEPIRSALGHRLIPVIFGDVVFDQALGGSILSTEDLFLHLAGKIYPERVLLAGVEAGVFEGYPDHPHLIDHITPASFPNLKAHIRGSQSEDVTGGMLSKVEQMLNLAQAAPNTVSIIFSGIAPGSIRSALQGEVAGTKITAAA